MRTRKPSTRLIFRSTLATLDILQSSINFQRFGYELCHGIQISVTARSEDVMVCAGKDYQLLRFPGSFKQNAAIFSWNRPVRIPMSNQNGTFDRRQFAG